jgi:cytochrome c biogenesis protein CcdA
MNSFVFAIATACWLGILTSISPCPLATNIAAVSYIGRQVGKPRIVLLTGMLYTAGRTLTYMILGALIVAGVLSMPKLSSVLQKYMNTFLGPILILVGMFLLDMIRLGVSGPGISERMQERADRYGIWGAGFLGCLFALSFCPLSGVLFFGSLIPLAIQHQSGIIMPMVYGIGTALPAFIFAILIALGAGYMGRVFDRVIVFERWARRFTGTIFILVGIYFTMVYIFRMRI